MTMLSLFPEELIEFLAEIEGLGFSLCLIGGALRDFFLQQKLSDDLDFEIRSSVKIKKEDWPSFYKKLHQHLKFKKIPYTELPYLITRVPFLDFDLEFSSPRLEIPIQGKLDHHHFEAILDSNLSYHDAFKRRDLSINGVGMEMSFLKMEEVLCDPYEGKKDLKDQRLKAIDQSFFLDPVRFLRLIRFSIKLKYFTIDPDLSEKLSLFDLSDLSLHHLREEMMKSKGPGAFLNLLAGLMKKHDIKYPREWSFLLSYNYPEEIKTIKELLVFIFLQNPKDAQEFLTLFSLPKKELHDLTSFAQSVEILRKTTKEDIKQVAELPLKEAIERPLLRHLKNLEDKKEWKTFFPGLSADQLVFAWNDWENIVVSKDEFEKLEVKVRSYYRFYKAIQEAIKEKKR